MVILSNVKTADIGNFGVTSMRPLCEVGQLGQDYRGIDVLGSGMRVFRWSWFKV